jgi:hypothetical protein
MCRTALAVAVITVLAACAPASPAPVSDNLAWAPFRWRSYEIAGKPYDRAALFVPIVSDSLGGAYYLQLDTGADVGIWLSPAVLDQLLRRRGVAWDSTRGLRIDGRIGAYPLQAAAVNRSRYQGDTLTAQDTLPKIGSLGLNFFRARQLLLDFPRMRFAIVDSAQALPRWITERISWVPIEYRNNKMFVPLTLNGREYRGFFYDSGASLFAVNTTPEIWRAATGRTGTEPDNVDWRVPSFGQQILMRGAPVRSATVGGATLQRPLAFYLAEGPERLDFSKWGFPVEGLFGNALFYDHHLIVVDLPRGRFGVMERSGR